jgi:diguanylate cyclase (GGDEF)-like protein/PAS domain S-box-containing protein
MKNLNWALTPQREPLKDSPHRWQWGSVIAVMLTLLVVMSLRNYEDKNAAIEFHLAAIARLDQLQGDIRTTLNSLSVLGSDLDAYPRMDRATFHRLTQPLLPTGTPTQALQWVPRVSSAQRARYTRSARQDGFGHFEFTERPRPGVLVAAGARSEYFPVFYVEPYLGGEKALGFDLYSESARRQAMQNAAATGKAFATSRLILVQKRFDQYGFLVFRPVYRGGVTPATPAQRQSRLIGYVDGVFSVRTIVEGMSQNSYSKIQLVLFDSDGRQGQQRIYPSALSAAQTTALHASDQMQRQMEVAGRVWTLIALPKPGALEPNRDVSTSVLILGLLASLLWCVNLRQRSIKQATIEHTVEMRTRELNQERLRIQTILKTASDGIHILDADGLLIMANQVFLEMLGYDESAVGKLHVSDWDPSETWKKIRGDDSGVLALHNHGVFETRHRRRDGSMLEVEISASGIEIEGHNYLYAASRDITERKHAEQQMRISAIAFESQEGMVVTDADSTILRVNQAFSAITGYSADEVIGQPIKLLQSGHHDAAFYAAMWQDLKQQGLWQGEIWNRRKNGEIYPEWLTITAVKNAEGSVANYVATLTDITLRKAAEDEVKHLAFYDPLTLLPNRRLLRDRLQQSLVSCNRSGLFGALLFIDLDNFKTLNDTMGHGVGDQMLQQAAQRISGCVREHDTVARLGGDEFVVMLDGLNGTLQDAASATEVVGEKILATLRLPFQLLDQTHYSTASIGATLFDAQQNTIDELLKRADLAMYQAKTAGRNTLRFFDPEMQAVVMARAAMEADLRLGMQHHEFHLYYQPQIDDSGAIIGAEALIRWLHPEHGLIPPNDFIPLAETNGLILPLGQWVLATACQQLITWAGRPETAGYTLAVNVSARQFHHPDFVEHVTSVLDHSGANPHRLKLELTESVLLDDVEDAIAKMMQLKARGVSFSLDDFGTGYSSFSYLQRLPIDQLKIDQSFVEGLVSSASDDAIAKTIVALAQTLELAVIAEGVETAQQRDFLSRIGCKAYQGYLYSRPLPLDQFEAFAARH